MTDVRWVPLVGGTVITLEGLGAPAGIEAGRAARGRPQARAIGLRADIRRMGDVAVAEMQKRGLKVVEVDAATRRAVAGGSREGVPEASRRLLSGRTCSTRSRRCGTRIERKRRPNDRRPGVCRFPHPVPARAPLAGPWRLVTLLENTVALTVLAAMTLLPIVEVDRPPGQRRWRARRHRAGPAPDALDRARRRRARGTQRPVAGPVDRPTASGRVAARAFACSRAAWRSR